MLLTRPQKSSGCFAMICGPGAMPWIIIAPIIMAMIAFGGMPSESMGMKPACAAALLAASGAATPSTAPLPKRDGSREIFFSRL
jgi:hypothetical protein